MVNSIPAYIREIFTYQIPVVVPALGLAAGSIYAAIFMVTALVKILLVVFLGRACLEERSYHVQEQARAEGISPFRAASKAIRGLFRTFARISRGVPIDDSSGLCAQG
jgi:hypothetical protein